MSRRLKRGGLVYPGLPFLGALIFLGLFRSKKFLGVLSVFSCFSLSSRVFTPKRKTRKKSGTPTVGRREIYTEQMDAEGLGRKLLLTPPGDTRKPWQAGCRHCDGGISQNAHPASTFELSQCWHCKERLPECEEERLLDDLGQSVPQNGRIHLHIKEERRLGIRADVVLTTGVATPAEPRGENVFFVCANFGRWKTFKISWKVPVKYF